MRIPYLALLLICLPLPVLADGNAADEAPDRTAPLRGADCLDPSAARGWHDVDASELLVDAGRRKYRLVLEAGCSGVGDDGTVVFQGDPVSGRLCGHLGDRVRSRGVSCRVERIELIDADDYRAALGGEAAGEPPAGEDDAGPGG